MHIDDIFPRKSCRHTVLPDSYKDANSSYVVALYDSNVFVVDELICENQS